MPSVELVYAPLLGEMLRYQIIWQAHMTVADAVRQSGVLQTHPEVVDLSVGVFARLVTWDTLVKPGDRIELYRPLLIDPKEKRRMRAKG
jgi:putative ubiquitin-RnfH superfamily antitoxin RatB of RatAB toxin-antitoxin module